MERKPERKKKKQRGVESKPGRTNAHRNSKPSKEVKKKHGKKGKEGKPHRRRFDAEEKERIGDEQRVRSRMGEEEKGEITKQGSKEDCYESDDFEDYEDDFEDLEEVVAITADTDLNREIGDRDGGDEMVDSSMSNVHEKVAAITSKQVEKWRVNGVGPMEKRGRPDEAEDKMRSGNRSHRTDQQAKHLMKAVCPPRCFRTLRNQEITGEQTSLARAERTRLRSRLSATTTEEVFLSYSYSHYQWYLIEMLQRNVSERAIQLNVLNSDIFHKTTQTEDVFLRNVKLDKHLNETSEVLQHPRFENRSTSAKMPTEYYSNAWSNMAHPDRIYQTFCKQHFKQTRASIYEKLSPITSFMQSFISATREAKTGALLNQVSDHPALSQMPIGAHKTTSVFMHTLVDNALRKELSEKKPNEGKITADVKQSQPLLHQKKQIAFAKLLDFLGLELIVVIYGTGISPSLFDSRAQCRNITQELNKHFSLHIYSGETDHCIVKGEILVAGALSTAHVFVAGSNLTLITGDEFGSLKVYALHPWLQQLLGTHGNLSSLCSQRNEPEGTAAGRPIDPIASSDFAYSLVETGIKDLQQQHEIILIQTISSSLDSRSNEYTEQPSAGEKILSLDSNGICCIWALNPQAPSFYQRVQKLQAVDLGRAYFYHKHRSALTSDSHPDTGNGTETGITDSSRLSISSATVFPDCLDGFGGPEPRVLLSFRREALAVCTLHGSVGMVNCTLTLEDESVIVHQLLCHTAGTKSDCVGHGIVEETGIVALCSRYCGANYYFQLLSHQDSLPFGKLTKMKTVHLTRPFAVLQNSSKVWNSASKYLCCPVQDFTVYANTIYALINGQLFYFAMDEQFDSALTSLPLKKAETAGHSVRGLVVSAPDTAVHLLAIDDNL